ncbi:MAG: DMT family transporter [Rubrivivax sp.]|jgi:drug/metabolite transporter (DMT)-like permease
MSALTPRLALLMTLPPLLWAGNAVVGRLLVGVVPPLTLNLMRWVLTGLILLPLVWSQIGPGTGFLDDLRARWRYLLLLGLLGVGLFNSLQYLALVTSSALNVTLVASSMPVWMLAVGRLFYGERPRPAQYAGAALGLLGVLTVIARGDWRTLAQVQLVAGDLFILAAIIGWAFYSWLLARPPAPMRAPQRPQWDWAAFLFVQVLFGSFAAAVFSTGEQLAGAAPIRWDAGGGWGVWVALAYVSLGASVVAYRCWGLGVAQGGPALAAFFNNLTPLFAALISAAVLGETPQGYHAVAFVLIVAGIVVSSRAPRGHSAAPRR